MTARGGITYAHFGSDGSLVVVEDGRWMARYDAHGRFTPDRSELEWIRSGVYHSLDAPGLELPELVAIAASTGANG